MFKSPESREKLINWLLSVLKYAITAGLGYFSGVSEPMQTALNVLFNPSNFIC